MKKKTKYKKKVKKKGKGKETYRSDRPKSLFEMAELRKQLKSLTRKSALKK